MFAPGLGGSQNGQGKRVYPRLELLRQCGIDAALPLDSRRAFECGRHYAHVKMRFAARTRTGMTFVPRAFVHDLEFGRGESRHQLRVHRFRHCHGRAFGAYPVDVKRYVFLFFHLPIP